MMDPPDLSDRCGLSMVTPRHFAVEGQPRSRYGQNERGEVALHNTSKYTLPLDG